MPAGGIMRIFSGVNKDEEIKGHFRADYFNDLEEHIKNITKQQEIELIKKKYEVLKDEEIEKLENSGGTYDQIDDKTEEILKKYKSGKEAQAEISKIKTEPNKYLMELFEKYKDTIIKIGTIENGKKITFSGKKFIEANLRLMEAVVIFKSKETITLATNEYIKDAAVFAENVNVNGGLERRGKFVKADKFSINDKIALKNGEEILRRQKYKKTSENTKSDYLRIEDMDIDIRVIISDLAADCHNIKNIFITYKKMQNLRGAYIDLVEKAIAFALGEVNDYPTSYQKFINDFVKITTK